MFASSCSVAITNGGQDAPRFTTQDTRASVEKAFGKPVATKNYSPPILAGGVLMSAKFRLDRKTKVASQADYQVRRWIREAGADNGTALAMWSGATLGVAEVFTFPASMFYAGGKMREVHHFRVWYSQDDHYIDHLQMQKGD